MLISVSSPHKNIYQEQFANFDLNKNENDNSLMANNGKILINICVADFCSYCFNINFIKKAACPCMLPLLCPPAKSTFAHRISIFL